MPRAKVVVNMPDGRAYDVQVGEGVLDLAAERVLGAVPEATSVVLVSDSNVAPLYAAPVKAAFRQAGLRTLDITLPAGEESKSVACVSEVWRALAQQGVDRNAVVCALGGGVVGDLAGFVAATYMRGVHFVQLPTTLLAMVDSSVGGKTGINLDEGKNLVGAFKQPAYVGADLNVLESLPAREWACGLGEVAKTAALDSDDFFFWMCEHADALRERDVEAVREAIVRCVVFKADVVARDETERAGVRECLNYGHTLGHAIEKLAGYGTFSHGAAVAEGMRFASRLAVAELGVPLDFMQAQDQLLDDLGLEPLDFSAPAEDVLAAMKGDKKAHAGAVRFVLPRDVGAWELATVSDEVLLEHLGAWGQSK